MAANDVGPSGKGKGATLDPRAEFPRYLVKVNGKRQFMTMQAAGVAYDSGWQKVELLRIVLEADYTVRDLTEEEEREISRIADAHSDSK